MYMDQNDKNGNRKAKGKKHVIHYQGNPSSQLLFEDALFGCLYHEKGENYKTLKTKWAPRNKHSPFGDFPKDFMPKRIQEISIAPNEGADTKTQNIRVSQSISNKKINDYFTKSFLLPKNKIDENKNNAPVAGAFKPRNIPLSDFRLRYDRGDLPILVEHKSGCKIKWKNDDDFENFDFQLFLPIFFDGLREKCDPYRFLAIQGTFDLLDRVKDVVVKVIPQLILPLKTALNTRDPDIIIVALKVIQKLVTCSELSGEALVPYYRQLLPIFNMYKNFNTNIGDQIDYGQRKKKNLGDLINETLEIMEINGGDDAFINIKYMIPTYESCCYEIRG